MSLNQLEERWNQFWFSPTPAIAVGVMRATLGFVLVASLLDRLPVLQELYSVDGPIPPVAAAATLPWPRISPMDWLQSAWQIQLFMAVALSVFVALMVGWKSRLMALLASWVRMLARL